MEVDRSINVKLLGAALSIALLVYRYLIYPLFVSPLSRIPSAHWSAGISPLWILWVRYTRKENRTIHAAHSRLGPAVRLGPKEISVNCVDGGIRTIYAGGFEKHDFYPNLFPNFGDVPNMFSTVESRPHSVRKRMISNVYSKSYLQTSKTMAGVSVKLVRERLLPRLSEHAERKEDVDVFRFFNAVTMDFVTCYQFGFKNGGRFLLDREEAARWFEDYENRKAYVFWPQEMPGVNDAMSKIGIHLSPKWVGESNKKLEAWAMARCDAAEAAEAVTTEEEYEAHPEDIPVVYRQLKAALAKECEKSPVTAMTPGADAEKQRLSRASEMLDQLSAGQETSAITLTYLFHELCLSQDLQGALRTELHTEVPSLRNPRESLPSPKAIDSLPLLNAILMETLRRHAAIPGPQPRITPHGADTSLAGYPHISPNTRVSSSAYSLHRNPDVFPSPERFDPYRWLKPTAEMQRWFWPFSSGGRMCIGSHLAIQEMKLVAACIVANFKVGIAEGGDVGIEQEDEYTAAPKGQRLVLKFARV